ncbi:MAG: hypothetical protein U0167_09365 [bacterium]
MNTLSRLQAIHSPATGRTRRAQIVRVVVRDSDGADQPQVTLAPGDRLIVENRTSRPLHVAPIDFFGNPFCRYVLEAGEATTPLVVAGLWFQVELRGRQFYPLNVYLAPNEALR